jgi:Na+/melibiose symporter-like transporter
MSDRLSRRTKLLYGAGDTGFSLTATIIGAYFAIFLTDVVHISPGIAAAAIFIGRSWDYVNDPLIGHVSDRTRTRWGRRRPFLLFGALPFALAFTMLWFRPPWESELALVIYYAVAYVIYDAAATFVYMPYFALTPELTPDYDERTALTSYRMFFSILGSLVSFTVPLIIVGAFMPENAPRVLAMGAIFGLASALPLLLAFFVTAIFALPFWERASRRWNKRWAYVAGIAFWAVVQIVLITVNPATELAFILFLCVLAGIGVGAAHVLPWSIIPDAIEWGEWQTGERHEGMFYSLVTLMQKVASSIAIPLVLLLLQVTGYVPNAVQQPANALLGIRVVIGPIPAALLCGGILFAILYPLGRERYAQVCRELEQRRAAQAQRGGI